MILKTSYRAARDEKRMTHAGDVAGARIVAGIMQALGYRRITVREGRGTVRGRGRD